MKEYRYEDLYIGLTESFEVEITEEMMKSFLIVTGDENPLHNDGVFAKEQGYENKVVYGMLTSSFVSRLVGVYLPGKYCLLQGLEAKYLRPVYVRDRLNISGSIDELHESVKRASVKFVITNQHGKRVVKGKADVGFLEIINSI